MWKKVPRPKNEENKIIFGEQREHRAELLAHSDLRGVNTWSVVWFCLFFCYFFSILLISEQSDRDFHSGLVSWRTAARRSAPTSKPSAWFDGGAVVKRNDWRAAGKSGHFSRHEEKPGVKEK